MEKLKRSMAHISKLRTYQHIRSVAVHASRLVVPEIYLGGIVKTRYFCGAFFKTIGSLHICHRLLSYHSNNNTIVRVNATYFKNGMLHRLLVWLTAPTELQVAQTVV